jgi:DedD protein
LNQAMKQRLIGTIVLGCLALIFIPILLDGEGIQEPTPLSVTVPPIPEVTITPLPDPVRPVILSDTDALDISNTTAPDPNIALTPQITEQSPAVNSDVQQPAQENAEAPTPVVEPEPATEPRLTTQGLPEGWSVRLGTFSDRGNAEALVARLILENYKAYSRPVQSGSQTMLAVYVGPVLTQAEAKSLQQQLTNEQQLKDTVVVQFTIDAPAQEQ